MSARVAADGAAGQAQVGGDCAQRAALGQQSVDRGVAGLDAVGESVG
ncbi:hypothetical protein [Catenulispora pinisilvae]|nr:hypothetical protein [Catenulispora pinisilvae]